MTEAEVREESARDREPLPPGPESSWTRWTIPFRTPIGLLAVVLIAVQAVWRGGAIAGGFFTQDDFVLVDRAVTEPLDLAFLNSTFAGGLSPVGNLLVWLVTQWATLDWGKAALVMVGLQTLAAVLMWLVLTRILEDRWVRLPIFAVALFSPLTLGSSMWFALAMMHLPTAVFFLAAVLALLKYLQDGWQQGQVVAGAFVVAALLCSDHTLLLPLPLFVVAACVGMPAEASFVTRLTETAREHARLWAALVLAVAGRVLWETSAVGNAFGWPSDAQGSEVAQQYARQGVPGLIGGPWQGELNNAVLVPSERWPLAVAILGCLLLLVPLLRSGRPNAIFAVAGMAAYAVGGVLLLLATQDGPGTLGMIGRFLADALVVAVVLVAVAVRGTPLPRQLNRFVSGNQAFAALGAVLALVASAAVTTGKIMPALKNTDDRDYVANIRSGLESDPRIVLLDGPVPEGVMTSWFGEAARISTIVTHLPEAPTFDRPSEFLRMVDSLGLVRAFDLLEPISALPSDDQDCGYPVRATPTTIRMAQRVPAGERVMRVGYYLAGDSYALLELADDQIRIPVRDGLHTIDIPVTSEFDTIRASLETMDTTLCVTSVTVGVPFPAALPPAE